MSTPITVIGTIATDLKQVVTQAGVSLTSFRLASSERRYDRQQQKWVDGETNWYSVAAFRALGEHAQESFRKGERVIVSGRLRIRNWETDEKSGIAVEIDADAIGHDVRWGVSSFERRSNSNEISDSHEDTARRDDASSSEPNAFTPEASSDTGFGPQNAEPRQAPADTPDVVPLSLIGRTDRAA